MRTKGDYSPLLAEVIFCVLYGGFLEGPASDGGTIDVPGQPEGSAGRQEGSIPQDGYL